MTLLCSEFPCLALPGYNWSYHWMSACVKQLESAVEGLAIRSVRKIHVFSNGMMTPLELDCWIQLLACIIMVLQLQLRKYPIQRKYP